MRKKSIAKKSIGMAVAALFAAIAISTSASARQISTLSGSISRSQVKKDCSANGGAYIDWGKMAIPATVIPAMATWSTAITAESARDLYPAKANHRTRSAEFRIHLRPG